MQLSNLFVNNPGDPAFYLLLFQPGATPFRQEVGFRAVPLSQVRAVVGYQPVLPSADSLPPGFQLAEVTVATTAQPTGSEGANPQSRNVVSVAYRGGFDRIVVTTRSTGTTRRCTPTSTATCWADPVASGEGFRDEPNPSPSPPAPWSAPRPSWSCRRGGSPMSERSTAVWWSPATPAATSCGGWPSRSPRPVSYRYERACSSNSSA